MTGNESNPASLFRLYVDYGRLAEATNLLIEYIESLASVSSLFLLASSAFKTLELCTVKEWIEHYSEQDLVSHSFFVLSTGIKSSLPNILWIYYLWFPYSYFVGWELKSFTIYLQRPADVIRRKAQFAVWFPYTTIERLWCLLEESIRLGHRIDQSENLKKLLHSVLVNHLNLVHCFSRLFFHWPTNLSAKQWH